MLKRVSGAIVDPFLALLVGTAVLAVIWPAHGSGAKILYYVVDAAIALLFFTYGLRLAPSGVVRGFANWRLQVLVIASTFIVFPLIGLSLAVVARSALPPPLWAGIMFVCVLPSTMQSSIAFTSIARGNVSAAFCSASVSSLLGIILTPLLVAILLQTKSTLSWDSARGIGLQLLLPFVAGQALRPLLGSWLEALKRATTFVDRGSILIVVYAAFSEGTAAGVWSQISIADLTVVLCLDVLILATVLLTSTVSSRRFGFATEDEIAIVFCGSKKSLAAGIPMANILFAGKAVSLILLPMMLFHQIQLFVCAILARRYANRRA